MSYDELKSPAEGLAARRILDANFNRASEGLRVIEDYCRFAISDRHLAQTTKQIRHDVGQLAAQIAAESLANARETLRDVGTSLTTSTEATRANLREIVTASTKRVEQSLRTIEEFAKLTSPAIAAAAKQLRYRTYTLARAITIGDHAREKLPHAKLYVLVSGMESEEVFVELIRDIILGGVDVIQLRDKSLNDRQLLDRAKLLRSICYEMASSANHIPTPILIMNDRADIAVAARLHGVHVGQEELPVDAARSIVGSEMLIGVSTHSLAQAQQAVLDGASYIGCGPVFPSNTKQFGSFVGTDLLREVASEISLPAFAIGGITAANLGEVKAAGFSRIAVSGAITSAESPQTATRELQELLD